ncbi:hypothetical protein M3231_19920 [Neobacillus mesonae]|nr:hypothetical protein [Neobacillus mesonae]
MNNVGKDLFYLLICLVVGFFIITAGVPFIFILIGLILFFMLKVISILTDIKRSLQKERHDDDNKENDR